MKKIHTLLLSIAILLGGIIFLQPAAAVDVFEACGDNANTAVCEARRSDTLGKTISNVTQALLFIIGAIAVIMIIIGGIRYVVSGGDQSATAAAKNTVLYAVIGLAVAILGYAIVNFVSSSIIIN